MVNQRKKEGSTPKSSPSTLPVSPSTPGAFSLRLPPPLRTAADKYAESTGISLNGLVCIALADYLAARVQGGK
jgi:predicted HicB family RNase H-like nuclease